jgi:hypothetical protein
VPVSERLGQQGVDARGSLVGVVEVRGERLTLVVADLLEAPGVLPLDRAELHAAPLRRRLPVATAGSDGADERAAVQEQPTHLGEGIGRRLGHAGSVTPGAERFRERLAAHIPSMHTQYP